MANLRYLIKDARPSVWESTGYAPDDLESDYWGDLKRFGESRYNGHDLYGYDDDFTGYDFCGDDCDYYGFSAAFVCQHGFRGSEGCRACQVEFCYNQKETNWYASVCPHGHADDCIDCEIEYLDSEQDEYDAWYMQDDRQDDFYRPEVAAHDKRKQSKAKRRNDTIRHHNRRQRIAALKWWSTSRTQRAKEKPWLVHSGALQGGVHHVDREKLARENLRFELVQAGLELAGM